MLWFARFWLPVIVWFVLIFAGSADVESANRSSRFIGPILKWLVPGLSDARVADVVLFIRKCAHATEYAVLAWLFWRALRQHVTRPPGRWSWRVARLAFICTTAYAATDELHQCFVPSRQGSIWDVALDAGGAVLGLTIIWFAGRWLRKW